MSKTLLNKRTLNAILIVATCLIVSSAFSQDQSMSEKNDVYHQIPDYPDEVSAQNVLARTIDGLGYRYYWATEGLRPEDLNYEPGNKGRTAGETLDHLYGLSEMVLNAVKTEVNVRPVKREPMSWTEKRSKTLQNIWEASNYLKDHGDKDMNQIKIIFQRGEQTSDFPIWNLLNGPLADALYHTGQIASFRRSSGNPMNPGVNVFIGKTSTQ